MASLERQREFVLSAGYCPTTSFVRKLPHSSFYFGTAKLTSFKGDGDPSQDVSVASVLFLVDGKLVLLQPSVSEEGDLKYDMRIVAHDVEYYILMRDQLSFNFAPPSDEPTTPAVGTPVNVSQTDISLRDSLWIFCGQDLLVWGDVQDVLRPVKGSPNETVKPLPIPVDFYPLSILLNKGVVLGAEPEMIQRRDATFSLLRFAIRVSCHPYQT